MRAGSLSQKITPMRPVYTTDDFGTETVEYIEQPTISAELVYKSRMRTNLVGEQFPDYGVLFNLRIQHRIAEHWRIQHLGGHLYEVQNIEYNEGKQMQTLYCSRVNP